MAVAASPLAAPLVKLMQARPVMQTCSLGQPLPMCRMKFQVVDGIPLDLQLISAWDVPNLRCPPVMRASSDYGTRKLTEIAMDSAYFHYQVSACMQTAQPS